MPNAARFESLELRRLMAVTIPTGQQAITDVGPGYTGEKTGTIGLAKLTFDNGVLTVYGTSSGETIYPIISRGKLSFETIRYFANGALPKFGTVTYYDPLPNTPIYDSARTDAASLAPVQPAGDLYRVDFADVNQVVVLAGDGGDVVDLTRLTLPAEVRGGAGGDTITGGLGDDSLYGDSGEDQISDSWGNDLLDGGRGGDLLIGRKGANTLLGGTGDDRLCAYSPENVLDGGAEVDTAVLRAAPDEMRYIDRIDRERSTVAPTEPDALPIAGRVTLRRDGKSLDLDAVITVSSGGWAVDWDLVKNSRGEVVVNATPYHPLGGAGQALTPHTVSYDLDQPLKQQRSVRVSLAINGQPFVTGRTLVTPAFNSKSFVGGNTDYAYDLVPANESLVASVVR